jgi:hypothetical protein
MVGSWSTGPDQHHKAEPSALSRGTETLWLSPCGATVDLRSKSRFPTVMRLEKIVASRNNVDAGPAPLHLAAPFGSANARDGSRQ